ncbi:MAG: DALR domain-containing protein [Patescibacteria group bacterium]
MYYLKDLIAKEYSALSLRYFFLTARYQTPLSFTFDALDSAQNALLGILRLLSSFPEGGRADSEWIKKFDEALSDDLDTPKAVALIFDVLRSNLSEKDTLATILEFDAVLGLNVNKERKKFTKLSDAQIPMQMKNLLTERENARAKKDFARADALRVEIETLGFLLEDSPEGPRLTKK